jgi:hypothetical protein
MNHASPNWVTGRDDSIKRRIAQSSALTRCDQLISRFICTCMLPRETDLLDQPHCWCSWWPSFVLLSRYCICVCVKCRRGRSRMSPSLSWFSFWSLARREPRLCSERRFLLFAPGPLYTYMDHKSRRRRPHLTQGCSSRGWLGVFPTCMQQPQIESLKREFIMQPANKNAQGYTRSAQHNHNLAPTRLSCWFLSVIFMLGLENHCFNSVNFQMPFFMIILDLASRLKNVRRS